MSFSKVVLIIVTLIVLDYAQVAAQEDLQVAESKGKKYPRHIQPNVRPTQERYRSFGRSNPARGRSDSNENGDEENGPTGYVILSYGGRLGKGTKGQRYGNKYGSDYSVEYVGNLYGYEDGHGYGSGFNSGYNNGYNSGHGNMANIQHGTSTGDGSHESDGSKGKGEPMGDLSVLAVDVGSDGTKGSSGPMDDSIIIGGNGMNEDFKVNADTMDKGTGTAATDGSMTEETPIVAVDATEIKASKGKGEVMVDSVITSEDATLSIDELEAGGETFGSEGVKVTEAMGEMVPLIEGDETGSVVATKTVGTMDELMALLGDIGGSEGSTSPVKSMGDLLAIMGEAEGIEGISDIAEVNSHTTGIDGSAGNFGTTGSVLDSFATGGQDVSNSGTAGSVEEGAASLSVEEEYTVSVDLVTEDETMDHVASGKITNANEQNPFADSLVMDENGDLASVTSDAVKASASYIDAASGAIITEESKTSSGMSEIGESVFEPVEMLKATALTTMDETDKMVIHTADMVTMNGETEGASLMDTGSAPPSRSEQSSAPSIASGGTSRRMGRNLHDSRRPINYRNGDRRSIAVVKGHHPGNRARPQNRAISSKPMENLKYENLPGKGERVRSLHPGSVRNVPMSKSSRQVTTSSMPANGESRFRSIGEGNSAPRGMKENGPMGSKSVRSSPGNGNNKAMPVNVEMVSKEAGSVSMKHVSATPITEQGKNAASSNPSGSAGSGKKRFLSMGKGRNTSGNSGKLESGSGNNKSAKHSSGSEEKGKKSSGNGDKMTSHGGKGSTRPARPAQLMSPPPSEEMMPPKSTMGGTSKPDMASENQEQSESTSEKPSGKGKRANKTKNSVKAKRQISGSISGSSSSSEKGKNRSEKDKGKEIDASESSGGTENVNGDEGRQNNGFVRNAPQNIVRYLRKGIGRYL